MVDFTKDDAKLLNWWQSQYFKAEDEGLDALYRADALRNLMTTAMYCSETGIMSDDACSSVHLHLADKYARVVDSSADQSGLDNFAEQALLLSKESKNESNDWKSSLSMDLPCVRGFMSACQDTHNKIHSSGWEAEVSQCFRKSSRPSAAIPNQETHRHVSNMDTCSSSPPGTSKSINQSVSGHSDVGLWRSTRKANASSDSNTLCGVNQIKDIRTMDQQGCKRKTAPTMGADEHSIAERSFRTAREQLVIENQKKGGRSQVNSSSYGASKKTLGPRRAPRGFIPPVMSRNDESDSTISTDQSSKEQPVDERLKNIDQKMIELIMSEIMDHGPSISWHDIAGLEFAKKTIKEIVVWPMLRPDIFTGLRGPPKGLLLFGPPGTGKTLIGKCIASQSQSTFFSISASSLTSKWVGEGEKMVRALFAVARCHQPAVIFIDEIDSLLSQRSDSEHESSRRIKTEFLVQLDGATTSSEERILVVGATNRPQELDEAARRRFVKRLYIPLPEAEARVQIVVHLLRDQAHSLTQHELNNITEKTQGYSGADMANLCREAALGPIRSMSFQDIQNITAEQVRPILYTDFENALGQVRASVSESDLHLYLDWNTKFGSWSV